jgi:hypothetical protein
MPEAVDPLTQILNSTIGDALRRLLGGSGSPSGDRGGQGGSQSQPSLPPPMGAGALSDAIGAALIADGHSDLVTQGTAPDGSTYNEIGPSLLTPAVSVLWSLGWPVAYRTGDGTELRGMPVIFCPSASVLEVALMATYEAAGIVTGRTDLGQICADKLHTLGYADYTG